MRFIFGMIGVLVVYVLGLCAVASWQRSKRRGGRQP